MRKLERLVTLLVPSALAGYVVLRSHHGDDVTRAAVPVLVGLWCAMLGLLVLRVRAAGRRAGGDGAWEVLDVLTGTGRATMWTASLAIMGSVLTGWASMAVLGVLGLGCVYVATAWTALVAIGEGPWRRAKIARTILPEIATEGDPVREELLIDGVKIRPACACSRAAGRRAAAWSRATRSARMRRSPRSSSRARSARCRAASIARRRSRCGSATCSA